MKFIIVLWSLLVAVITSDKIGQFEVVEYSNLLRMNEFKKGHVILVACKYSFFPPPDCIYLFFIVV